MGMNGRAFPQAIEAERALLGGLIEAPDQLDTVAATVRASDFYRRDHRRVFELLTAMHRRGEHIDSITVPERVGRSGRVDDFGGLGYVVQLVDHVPSTANLRHYASLIRESARRREVIEAAGRLREAAYDGDVDSLLGEFAVQMEASQAHSDGEWVHISTATADAVTDTMERGEAGQATGARIGLYEFDELIGGIDAGDMGVIAARPAMGKSLLALQAGRALAGQQMGVGIISLEMEAKKIGHRAIVAESGVSASAARHGRLTESMYEAYMDAAESLAELPIYIDERTALTWGEVVAAVHKLHAQLRDTDTPLGAVFLDYLTLLKYDTRSQTMSAAVAAAAQGAKNLAKNLGIRVILVCQLNRGCEQRTDKRPMMSDLRDSGGIEQAAVWITFIYRDEVYHPDTEDQGVAELIVAKARNGKPGTARVGFDGNRLRFHDLDGDQVDRWVN